MIWEIIRRGEFAFQELDAAKALAVAFPDPVQKSTHTPPTPHARVRAFFDRLLGRSAVAVPFPLPPSTPLTASHAENLDDATLRATEPVKVSLPTEPAAESTPTVTAAAPRGSKARAAEHDLRGRLETVARRPKGISISGWAVDHRTQRGAADFVVACGDAQVEPARIGRRPRAKLNARHGLAANAEIGFTLFVPYSALGGEARVVALIAAGSPREIWRVGCRISSENGIKWLELAPDFVVVAPETTARSG